MILKQTSGIQHSVPCILQLVPPTIRDFRCVPTSIQQPATSNRQPASSIQQSSAGFTLLEILIAIFIFAIIVTTIFGSYRSVFSDTDAINKDMTAYAMARNCLNRMIIDLQSVHLHLPPDYAPPDFDDPPDPFRIVGETSDIKGSGFPRLRFASLAHLP